MKKIIHYVNERRISFSFSIGSIIYGLYHFNNPHVLSTSDAYKTINLLLGVIGGRYFGMLFVCLGTLKVIALIIDNTRLRLSSYFALFFAWNLLALCFLIAYLSGSANAVWIYIFMAIGMSTGIIDKPLKDVFDG